jgi:hypothetical protein
MDLWKRGVLVDLARRARAVARQRHAAKRSKPGRVAWRVARPIRTNQFARVASLAGNLGVTDATLDTLAAIRTLFPKPRAISEEDLLEYYGQASPSSPEAQPVIVTLDTLRTCIAASPPLSSPHKDGWRVEHFIALVADPDCGEALAAFMTVIVKGDVSQKIANLLSSATQVILDRKSVV